MVAARLVFLIIASAAAVSLTGCASVAPGPKDWAFQPVSKKEPAKLAFGRPDTDDVDLVLWCDVAKQEVKFTPVVGDDERVGHIALQSGRQTLELDLHQDNLIGPFGTTPSGAPLLTAFRSNYRLRMRSDTKRWQDLRASSANGRRQVQSFFDACK